MYTRTKLSNEIIYHDSGENIQLVDLEAIDYTFAKMPISIWKWSCQCGASEGPGVRTLKHVFPTEAGTKDWDQLFPHYREEPKAENNAGPLITENADEPV